MCKRIFYIDYKIRDNCQISKDYYQTSKGARYRIILDYNEMKFYIRNERDKRINYKANISYSTDVIMKRAAKNKLIKLGVDFKRESRKRTFAICEKGMTQEKWEKNKKLS